MINSYLGHIGIYMKENSLLISAPKSTVTNPSPTATHKQVWICDICHQQVHGRKQISIRCNRIEHWVHLRCAVIRPAQHTDTWTCHLHRHTSNTPPVHTGLVKPKPNPLIHSAPSHTHPTHSTNSSHPMHHTLSLARLVLFGI